MKNYIERLKNYWKLNDLTFIATFNKVDDKHGYFINFINPESKKPILYPVFDEISINEKRISFVYFNVEKLVNNEYYKVELKYTDNPKGKNNPYSLEIKNVTELNQNVLKDHLAGNTNLDLLKNVFQIKGVIEKEKAKKHIKQRFERLNNPEANKIIANLMREIGKGMYSSKQRMIFELLQNADDAPGKEKVEFHIDANGDYLFIMHDGAPFNMEDVDAITSAAESTKRKDKKKTGYKGIGFKSVFTDSEEVWIKSGSYQFSFMKSSPLFDDFETFHFSSSEYKEFPRLIEIHREKFKKEIESYNSSTDIPWQVIPIWQDNLPDEFTDSNFNNFNNPVQFALKVGANNIYGDDGYLTAISNIVKRPQFLLFLRNTSKFRSPKNKVTVSRTDNQNLIIIEKTLVEYIGEKSTQKKDVLEYTKQIYSDIKVNNEAFSILNIGLKKLVEKNDLNEDTHYFIDLDGNKIDTIPPKLASATETEISFGIPLVNNKISPEIEYIKRLPKYSSLFTYLPMEDNRFQLPFLVNADFVPSSDRQRIQGDNLWNKYIMTIIAEKHVNTLELYALGFIKDNSHNISYLSLLLMNLLPEDDTAQQIIDNYNQKYLEQLKIKKIVVNDINESQLLSNTILDNSGLTELFGNEIFYKIIDTSKRLPHSILETKYLKDYEYLNIETINIEELACQITPELCERLGLIIAQNSLYDKPELFNWLNKLVKYMPNNFGKIPFIVHNNTLFSLELLIEEDDAWLINEQTLEYAPLIKELGYNTIQLNLDKHSNIKEFLHSFDGYLKDKTIAYQRIAYKENLHKLPTSSKLKLIDFFQNSAFMVGIGSNKYFGELKLFLDEGNNPRPLRQLISRKENLEVYSINKFRIIETEYNNISVVLKKELIEKDEIFTSFILNEDLFEEWKHQFDSNNINSYVSDLKTIFSWVENKDDISIAKWAQIPWLFIDDKIKFTTSDKVYWSKAFNEISADKFIIIKNILESKEIKLLPVKECSVLIKVFPLKTDNNSEIDWSDVESLEIHTVNILLDWMEDDGSFGDFFNSYTIVTNHEGNYNIEKIEDIKIYDGSDKAIKNYIETNTNLSSLFKALDTNLCSENRSKIGLLQGDKLIKAIIESGEFDQNLALHLSPNLSFELLNDFIVNLNDFNLFTDKEYNGDTPEHFIISRLLKSNENLTEQSAEFENTIEVLRSKTYIDGKLLSNYTVSDRVSFGTKEDRKVLRLSEILTEFQGESDVLDKVTKSFTAITQQAKLRDLIFKTVQLKPSEIHTKIEAESRPYYSVYQVVFQLLDKKHGGKRNWSKKQFDEYFNAQEDEKKLHNSYHEFLDVLIGLPFTDLSNFEFINLKLKNCVDKNFAIESEYIPDWLEEWVNKDKVKRLEFLSDLGYNGINSPIVKLRKSIVETQDYDKSSVFGNFAESKSNMQTIWYTILWLAKYNSNTITQNIEIIKEINNYVRFIDKNNLKKITLPVIKEINSEGKRLYELQSVQTESELLKIDSKIENTHSIYKVLKNAISNTIFIDESVGKLSEYLNIKVIRLEESVDIKTLESKSKLWDAPFYKKWKYNTLYPIYIYEGEEIQYLNSFNNITINTFTKDLKVAIHGNFYISSLLKHDPLDHLPSSFPNEKLIDLKEWERRTLKEPSLVEENPYEEKYNETFDRMIQDRYGISEERQNDENSNAKKQALYFLEENGFKVNEGYSTKDYAALYNIVDTDGNKITFIVRSAKGGLLFLDKEHWEMLETNDTQLIAIYPGNKPRIFNDRMELLSDELQEKILFRIPNNKNIKELDRVFNGLESESHMILITSEKMKESLFSKLNEQVKIKVENDIAIGGDTFED